MTASLPVINYGEKDRGELSRQVVHSMKTMGFMFLENVPNYDEDELRWCVDFFFGLPQSKKLAIARRKYNPDSKLVSPCPYLKVAIVIIYIFTSFFNE